MLYSVENERKILVNCTFAIFEFPINTAPNIDYDSPNYYFIPILYIAPVIVCMNKANTFNIVCMHDQGLLNFH